MFEKVISLLNKQILLKLVVLLFIGGLYLHRSFNDFTTPFVKGDGAEYILMTEAFRNHGSPEIRVGDVQGFIKRYKEAHTWDAFYSKSYFERLEEHFTLTKNKFPESFDGFFCAKSGKWYSYHFFFYSFINTPMYVIGSHFGPIRPFYFTNAILVIITSIVLLFFTPFNYKMQVLAALCFCYSCCYWFLGWQHTEIFTVCFVVMGLVSYFKGNYLRGLVLLSIACLQNQPLIMILGFLALNVVIKKGWTIKNLLAVGACCALAFLPPLFYFLNFSSTNLIAASGCLDTKYITVNRIIGFFTDVNQGMILTIPLILLAYVPLLVREIRKMIRKEKKFDFLVLLPVAIICTVASVSTMGNWNHGTAIINRYATWLSMVVMIHVFYLCCTLKDLHAFVLMSYFGFTQICTTLYHQKFNINDWSFAKFTPLAKFILEKMPTCYNPDPMIFLIRSTNGQVALEEKNSPIVYFRHHKVVKLMVHRNKLNDLTQMGLDPKELENIRKNMSYNFDWGYVDLKYFKYDPSDAIYNFTKESTIRSIMEKIQNSAPWMKQIKEKAVSWGKTESEVIRIDAEYSFSLGEQALQAGD